MLKIKDNVDLKELEKYGLKPHYIMVNHDTGKTCIDYYSSSKYENKYGFFRLIPRKKILCFWFNSKRFENNIKPKSLFIDDEEFLDMDLLYDLIQAGLVEKVGENN